MRAVVTKQFPGRPDDEIDTRTIVIGEVITGELAAVAVREGWAKEQGAASVSEPVVENGDGETEADPMAEFDGMKKSDLLKIAEAEGVPVDNGMTKAVLIDAILAARAAEDA